MREGEKKDERQGGREREGREEAKRINGKPER